MSTVLYSHSRGMRGLGCGCGCNKCNGMSGLGSYGKSIEWNTEPVINQWPFNRDGYWDCSDWMTWHGKVKAKYGQARANEVFMIWWNKQNFVAYAQDCYILNRTFRDWWKAQGLDPERLIDFTLTNQIDLVTDASGKITDAAGNVIDNAADAAGDASALISTLVKVLKVAVPVVVVGAVVAGGFYVYKNYVKGNRKVKVGTATV